MVVLWQNKRWREQFYTSFSLLSASHIILCYLIIGSWNNWTLSANWAGVKWKTDKQQSFQVTRDTSQWHRKLDIKVWKAEKNLLTFTCWVRILKYASASAIRWFSSSSVGTENAWNLSFCEWQFIVSSNAFIHSPLSWASRAVWKCLIKLIYITIKVYIKITLMQCK